MKAGAKTTDKDFNNLIAYLERFKGANITITVDRNPSPEKIAYIKERIKLSEQCAQNGRVVELVDTLGLSPSGQ
jgi:hypothetical protein